MDTRECIKSAADQLSAGIEEIRFSALNELVKLHSLDTLPHLVNAVTDSSYRIREEALRGICSFPKDAILPKLEDCLRDHENANIRTAAMEAFPRYGKEATAYLLPLLKDRDEEVRMFSATILGAIADPAAVESLIEALQDPDENVTHAAAESLGKISDARAVGPLIRCLEKDFWVQYPAVIALGSIGDLTATRHLIELLDDEMLRDAVIEALGKIGDTAAIPVLARTLSIHDPFIRNNAIASLVCIQRMVKPDDTCLTSIKNALNNDELIDYLIHSLENPDPEVRKNAIIALGWLKETKAVKNLVDLLQDYDLEEYVVGSLVSIGANAIPFLVEGLQNPDPKIRTSLIRCIEWIGNIDGIRACIPSLTDENSDVKYQAVIAMSAALECEEVEDALMELLTNPEPEIRDILVEILGRSRSGSLLPKLLPELLSPVYTRKYLAIQILGRLKNPQADQPLQKQLEDESDEIRAHVYTALSTIKGDGLPGGILERGLKDPSPSVRKAVARCIEAGSLKDPGGALRLLLTDPDPEVQLTVIERLSIIGNPSFAADLIEHVPHCSKSLRMAILRALGSIPDLQSTHFLTRMLKEPDPDLKRAAIESLGKIRDKRSIPDLIVALDDPEWSVRCAAIQALAATGDRRCAAHILRRLEDPEEIIKKEAIHAIGSLGYREAVNTILPLLHHEGLQPEILSALEKLGIPDCDAFHTFFRRCNTRLKCRLIEVLGRLKEPRTIDLLINVLQEEFCTIRCLAARALGESGDRRAIPPLLRLQKVDTREEVRKETALALKRLEARQ